MSCVFGIWGKHFDVDLFLSSTNMHPAPYQVHRRGEIYLIDKKRHYSSSVKFHASRAGTDQFRRQLHGAEKFLLRNKDEIIKAAQLPLGIQFMYLDFAVDHDTKWFMQTFEFPPSLCSVAGELKVTLAISIYSEPK